MIAVDPRHCGLRPAVDASLERLDAIRVPFAEVRDERAAAVCGANGSQALDSAAKGSGAANSEALGSEASGAVAAASLIVGDGQ